MNANPALTFAKLVNGLPLVVPSNNLHSTFMGELRIRVILCGFNGGINFTTGTSPGDEQANGCLRPRFPTIGISHSRENYNPATTILSPPNGGSRSGLESMPLQLTRSHSMVVRGPQRRDPPKRHPSFVAFFALIGTGRPHHRELDNHRKRLEPHTEHPAVTTKEKSPS